MISTHQADRILLQFADVAPQHEQRFLERFRQLRRFGVPSGVPRGRGVASGRTLEQMLETALAIHLLEAGLASSDVARLVRQEWVLARSVLTLFEPRLNRTQWPEGRPKDVYWVAAPAGLASYRSQSTRQPSEPMLKTIMLFEGDQLEQVLADLQQKRGGPLIVIRATDVVRDLLLAYAAAGEAEPTL